MTLPQFSLRPGRVDVGIPIELTFGPTTSVATLTNIGRGGLFIATDSRQQVGDRVSLTFRLPNQEQGLALQAEVRWLLEGEGRTSGFGLRFVAPPLEAAIAIQEFLRKADEDLTPSGPST